ncbi:MAG: HDIG domain-containing protein [Candidatus Muirbacterium halophilum]|nr:HDIG domain-containing protein [Candidatus Muirbacterium halophilum]MCK9474423.1 HDIG domain-containing protein [Candidatus Muirbacterium halophilum]
MNREKAMVLLKKYNKNEALIKHALFVEGAMKYFADRKNHDSQYWGIVGLLHDIDYELYPEEHCKKSEEILKKEGVSEDLIHAVISHGWKICSDVEPKLEMEKVLYTIDELTGLIYAASLMRPDKDINNMEVKSVKKKFKSKGFAAGVNRDIILEGCKMINMEINEVIEWTIEGMKLVDTEER